MKKISILIILFFTVSLSWANYTGTVTTNPSELTFSTRNGYNVVSFKGRHYTNTVGSPQIPVKTLSFLVPIDQKVSSIVINNTTIQQLSGSYNIYPAQTPIPTNRAVASAGFDNPNPSVYNSANPYPGITYSVRSDGYPLGYHVVTINFYPLQFIPASRILNLYTSINFTIVYANNTDNALRPNRQSAYSNNLTKAYIRGMVANPNDMNTVPGGARQVVSSPTAASAPVQNIRGMSPANLNSIPDYIIITRSDLVSSFQTLANWKTQKGVNTLIVKTDGSDGIYANYSGYDNAEKIRNYLKDVYVNFGSSYVLLGGDVNDASGAELIPARMTPVIFSDQSHPTNYYYATVNGNWNGNGNNVFGEDSELTPAEMSMAFLVGRAPVHSTSEVTSFTNKILGYEKLDNSLTTNKNYVKNLSFWCADGASGCGSYPYAMDYLNTLDNSSTGIINPSNYYVLKLYDNYASHIGEAAYADRYFQLNKANTVSSANTGWGNFGKSWGNTHLVYHCDHSGPTGMGTSSQCLNQGISSTDMDGFTNLSSPLYYPQILYTDGCDPADFSFNSISEHYVNNPNGGGAAFLGNTDAGYWGDDSYFEDYFMDALYSNTKASGLANYDNTNYHIGYLNDYSAQYDTRKKNRILLGDPEMMVWTNTPQTLGLTSTYSAAAKTISGTISGLTFAATPTVVVTVTAWKGSEIWQTKDINATTASPSYTLTNVFADTPGNITVTAVAHNYIPKINTVVVSSPISGAHPYMTSYVIDDDNTGGSAGNTNAFPDAGETIQLPVTLTNSGNATASTVTARLTWTAAPYQTQSGTNATITINPTYSVSTFGNIAASGTANNNASPFRFTVNKNAFNGITPRPLTQFINFTLSIYVNGVAFSTKTFILQITEPNLIKGENTVTGTLAANSTNNQLTVKLYNIGLSTATGLNATLSESSSNITLTNAVSTYPNINGISAPPNFGSNTTTFKFNMGSSAYTNQTFTLTVTNTYGKTWTFPGFNLSKPVINTATSTMGHYGYLTAIEPFWNIQLTTSTAIQGYNLYRSLTQGGTYGKVNPNIIPYASYLDQGLTQLTPYYYKVTVVDIHGNESAQYPTTGYRASTTLPIHAGWPVTPEPTSNQIMGGRCEGSPITYDLLGNGSKEIFFTSGYGSVGGVWAFNHDATKWYSYDNSGLQNGYINFQNSSPAAAAIADIDNDGITDLALTTRWGNTNSQKLLVYETQLVQNQAPATKPVAFPASVSGWEMQKGAVYSDLNNDGKLEVMATPMALEGIKIFSSNGYPYSGSVWSDNTGYYCGFTMPVAFDFNGDGKKEVVVGCSGKVGVDNVTHPAGIYIYNEDGTNYGASNPVYTPAAGNRTDSPPVMADLDNDGTYEIVFISAQNYTANIYAIKPNGTLVSGWNTSNHTITLKNDCKNDADAYFGLSLPTLAAGDLDKDGRPEVVCGDNGHLYIWNYQGTLVNDIVIPSGYATSSYKAPVIADVDNISTDLEVIISGQAPPPSSGANIYAYKMNGQPPVGFPITISSPISNTPCVDDVDNDGDNELIVTTGGKFYVWNSQGLSSNNVYGWTSYRHDNLNSGIFNSADGGLLNGNNDYLQNITTSTNANNMSRYYTGQHILAGDHVTTKKATGPVLFKSGSTIVLDAVTSVLLDTDVTIEQGCVFEIK